MLGMGKNGKQRRILVLVARERCRSRPGRLLGSIGGLASKFLGRSFCVLALLRGASCVGLCSR